MQNWWICVVGLPYGRDLLKLPALKIKTIVGVV